MWRPFHFESIRFEFEGVGQIAFERPRVNGLAAFLCDRAKFYPIAMRLNAKFLLKFDLSAREEIFIGRDFAFWNRPCAFIFSGKERATRMHEQEFQAAGFAAEHQQPRADTTSLRF